MSLSVGFTVTLVTSEHPLPQTASWGHLNIPYHKMLGTIEHPLPPTPRGHLNIPYHKFLGTSRQTNIFHGT